MSKFFTYLARLSVDRRGLVYLLIAFLTGCSLLGYFDPTFISSSLQSRSIKDSAPSDANSDSDVPVNVSPISLSNSDAVIVVESDDFFNFDTVAALRQVVDDLERLEHVDSVLWMDRVPILNIFGLPEPILPRSQASAQRFENSKQKALAHPLVAGQLLSADAQTLLMLVNFDYYFMLRDEDVTQVLKETAYAAADKFPDANLKFRVTGRLPSAIAAISTHESNQRTYQIFGYGMIFVMALILFRGFRAVIIVSLAPAFGVFWTVGIVRFFEYNDNPLIDVIMPVLVSLVGLTDGVHLMVQIRKLRSQGESAQSAAVNGLQQVGLACLLTSVTTAIGFGSLMLADSIWVQQFGLCCMVGVLLSFVAVVTVIPLACSSWIGSNVHVGQDRSLVDKNLNRIGGVVRSVVHYQLPLAIAGIACTLFFGGVSMTLRPDQKLTDGLPQSDEATQALIHVDRAFGGLEFSRIEVSWEESVDSASAEVLETISAVDELLASEPLLGHPLSIRNLLDAQPGNGPAEERMSLLELLPPPLKRAFYTPEENLATVNFRVQDLGIARYGPVFERVERGLEKIEDEHPDFQLALAGKAVWRWRNLYQIVVDLSASLGTASVIILIVLALAFRSLRLGLISIVPNLFPLALTGAYLAFAGYNLEIVMVCSFTVCLGIAVDDTIHFLTRFLAEKETAARNIEANFEKQSDDASENVQSDLARAEHERAIQRAFTGVGTALIMTTAVLVAGFAVVTFSDSRDHHIFAIMGVITIGAALFCDLIFLPAMLAVFARKVG